MRIWRRLSKVGAVLLKGSVYILPYNDERYEFCQWLVSEVTSFGGQAAFIRVRHIETMNDSEIADLFNAHRKNDYRKIETGLNELEGNLGSIRKGSTLADITPLIDILERYRKEYEGIKSIDFFSSEPGKALEEKINMIDNELRSLYELPDTQASNMISLKKKEDYAGKTWLTRAKPFVDRMASAWLILKFVDKKAVFTFLEDKEVKTLAKDSVAFDVRGGEFTHVGGMCTFEVLMKAFGLKEKALKKIAEIVHELDVKDDKYRNPESRGIEEILVGIRKTAKDDNEALEKGIAVFEMLYASKTL